MTGTSDYGKIQSEYAILKKWDERFSESCDSSLTGELYLQVRVCYSSLGYPRVPAHLAGTPGTHGLCFASHEAGKALLVARICIFTVLIQI